MIAYAKAINCKNYKEALQTILKFMENSEVYAISVWNNETNTMQFISETSWKSCNK